MQADSKMEKEVAETLAYFRDNAADLRQLGKEWGLSEEEIKECIENALSVDPKDLPEPESTASRSTKLKFAARKSWPKARVLLYVLGAFALVVGGVTLALQNDEIDHRFNQLIQPLLYPILRTLRLFSTPLHNMFNLYDYYFQSCFVFNPLFDVETALGDHICETCFNLTQPTIFTEESLEDGSIPTPAYTEPILIKARGAHVTLGTFQSVLSTNEYSKQHMLGITTNLGWASQPTDFLGEGVQQKLLDQPDFYFFWLSKQASISQLMRKLFPRPDAFGPKTETVIQKTIFLYGPKAQSFNLRASMLSSFNWYAQGSGSVEVKLTPPDMCGDDCHEITVTLEPQDLLLYNTEAWVAQVTPKEGDISISYLGSFNPKDL